MREGLTISLSFLDPIRFIYVYLWLIECPICVCLVVCEPANGLLGSVTDKTDAYRT
jgi:hypothetical protein